MRDWGNRKPSDRTIARFLKEKLDGTVQVASLKQDGTKVWKYDGRLKKVPSEDEIEDFIIRQVSLSDPPVDASDATDALVDRALMEIVERGLPAVSRDQILQDLMQNPKAIISQSIHTANTLDEIDNQGITSSIWRTITNFKDSLSNARFSFTSLILLVICFRLFEARKKREGIFFLVLLFLFLPKDQNESGKRVSSTVQNVRLKCSHQKH